MKNSLVYCIIILGVFTACEKDEIPVAKLDRGNTITQSVNESTYTNQLYFDLETNSFVKSIEKLDWDIAFGCGEHHELILSNTSKSVSVAKIANSNFEDITSIDGLEFVFESSTGHPDSTAFDNWNYTDVYIIDFGYNDAGIPQGHGKLKLISNSESEVSFEYGLLDDITPKNIILTKDDDYNAIFFSIKNQSIVEVEPPKADWDLCFTQYIYYFHTFETHYLVSGVLLNRSGVMAYHHESKDYTNLSFNDLDPNDFTANLDAVGYDWKVFSGGTYTTFSDYNYMIQSTEGFYFKLHFIDFYNDQGEKGFAKFEFQKI